MPTKIIGAGLVLTCNPNFDILTNAGVVIQKGTIIELGDITYLCKTYPNAPVFFDKKALLLPAFINPHVHFEFSGQRCFEYGSFEGWLSSLLKKRTRVLEKSQISMQKTINAQILSGVGSVGAISSYGLDRYCLKNSPLRVVFFDELIGGQATSSNFKAFSQRHTLTKQLKSARFIPAIAIHAPYSVHKDLAKQVLHTFKSSVISTHFLESQAELKWLENQQGWFNHFYTEILKVVPSPSFASPFEFLDLFKNQRLLLVHALFANRQHLKYAKRISTQTTLITCPRSNRLLSGKILKTGLAKQLNIPIAIATDGESSNYNINFLEELRIALWSFQKPLLDLLPEVLLGTTLHASKALGLNTGSLEKGKDADLALFGLSGQIEPTLAYILNWLLHARRVKDLWIQGERVVLAWRLKTLLSQHALS
ncbi:aminofutalosine deaminase family hydrolase [Helicobacter suis]|uniref:aminofutalosine deaminase family hydrolase n=1 Tax=Helicobacter suis TaxID=104628 RepID=UPI0013D3E4E9|nr:aminofutalosine deaminase family hydrolase [Helicobacter suis]